MRAIRLVVGIVGGLVVRIVCRLVVRIVGGLVVRIVCGLVLGLVLGLGLVFVFGRIVRIVCRLVVRIVGGQKRCAVFVNAESRSIGGKLQVGERRVSGIFRCAIRPRSALAVVINVTVVVLNDVNDSRRNTRTILGRLWFGADIHHNGRVGVAIVDHFLSPVVDKHRQGTTSGGGGSSGGQHSESDDRQCLTSDAGSEHGIAPISVCGGVRVVGAARLDERCRYTGR